jgi:pimeloyl-ACP methyl ester carboxylesterase
VVVEPAPLKGLGKPTLLATGLALGGVAWALGSKAIERRWTDAVVDPLDVDGLMLPSGEELVIKTDDVAELAATVLVPEGASKVGGRRWWNRGQPPVVLVHGWTNTRAVWAPVARRLLAAGHPVIAYDQRGHGQSTFGTEVATVGRLGDDVAAVLDELDLRDAVLAGHSMGGFSLLAFATNRPDDLDKRAQGLALIATAAHGIGLGSLDRLASQLIGSRQLGWALSRPRLGLYMVRGAVGRNARHGDLSATRDLFVATAPAVRAACYLAFGEMDMRAALPSIDIPTVVLTGDRDTVTPPVLGRAIAAGIPEARFELLHGAGHMLLLEETDQVVAAIRSLVDD